MQTPKITNICKIFKGLLLFAIFLFFVSMHAMATGEAIDAEHNKSIENEANKYFYEGLQIEDQRLKEAYLSEALKKYMLLLNIYPNSAILATHVAIIHDNFEHSKIAKEYFFRAVNIEPTNPYVNFYFGEYYFTRKDYQNALNYYKIAYNNGYSGLYEVNLKLGTIYERIGDIEKAKKYYSAASAAKPTFSELKNKIKSLDKIYYSKSDYK